MWGPLRDPLRGESWGALPSLCGPTYYTIRRAEASRAVVEVDVLHDFSFKVGESREGPRGLPSPV